MVKLNIESQKGVSKTDTLFSFAPNVFLLYVTYSHALKERGTCMTYLELNELKEELDKRGIRYRENRINGCILLYVNGLMQIENPTRKQQTSFWPYVRVSLHEGDYGYYVRACGVIHENQSMEQVLGHIYEWIEG